MSSIQRRLAWRSEADHYDRIERKRERERERERERGRKGEIACKKGKWLAKYFTYR
jgi:hypothetical protein